jgi:dTDP-glucose 4,6-dehydratase
MRIVVTGGAGFIGSHLCEYLLNKGYQVTCIDSLITGSKNNIAHLLGNKNFTFLEKNIIDKVSVDGKVDQVLHFASPASPKDYLRLQIHTLKVGAIGTMNALGLAKEKKAGFLLASTSEVYGDPLVHPQKEDYWGNVNPVGPRGVYDEAKRFAEALTMAYRRTHGLRSRIARIFNTYGPRMRTDDGRAVCTFITQALQNKNITVYGDGSQTRSFCYVSDLVEGIHQLMLSDEPNPVNLGNPDEATLLQLAHEIKDLIGGNSTIVFEKLPEDDPRQRRPDITRARTILKWEPKVPRKEGLLRTIEYMRTLIVN